MKVEVNVRQSVCINICQEEMARAKYLTFCTGSYAVSLCNDLVKKLARARRGGSVSGSNEAFRGSNHVSLLRGLIVTGSSPDVKKLQACI